MQSLALAIAFLFELVAFASFAGLGLLLHVTRFLHILLFLVLLIGLVTFWGLFMAPRAAHKFKPPEYYSCKAAIYALAALVLWVKMGSAVGLAFLVLAIVDEAVLFRHNLS